MTGRNLLLLRTPFEPRQPRFEVRTERTIGKDGNERLETVLIQRAMVEQGREWRIVQTRDTTNPERSEYSARSHMAKTVRWEMDGEDVRMVWGGLVSALAVGVFGICERIGLSDRPRCKMGASDRFR